MSSRTWIIACPHWGYRCACGVQRLTCTDPTCLAAHVVVAVEACGVCTCTGIEPVLACTEGDLIWLMCGLLDVHEGEHDAGD